MKKLHVAISTRCLIETIRDYTARLSAEHCVVLDEDALWRTDSINLSVRVDFTGNAGQLRHLGLEGPGAKEFTVDTDVNGILWECVTAQQQAGEINELWPEARSDPDVEL